MNVRFSLVHKPGFVMIGEEERWQLRQRRQNRFEKCTFPANRSYCLTSGIQGAPKLWGRQMLWRSLPAVGQFPWRMVIRTASTRRSPLRSTTFDGSPKQRIYRLQLIWRAVMEIRARKRGKLSVYL